MSKPVYRINLNGQIIIFEAVDSNGIVQDISKTDLEWDYLYSRDTIKWYDGTSFDVGHIADIRKYDVECPVIFRLYPGGYFRRTY